MPGCGCSHNGIIAVGCDVARSGNDRTVIYVMQGGRILHGEAIARNRAVASVFYLGAPMTPDEERAREIAAELVTDAFWRFGKKPSNKARELCVKWTDIIAQALARERREENEACAKVADRDISLQGMWIAKNIRARQETK